VACTRSICQAFVNSSCLRPFFFASVAVFVLRCFYFCYFFTCCYQAGVIVCAFSNLFVFALLKRAVVPYRRTIASIQKISLILINTATNVWFTNAAGPDWSYAWRLNTGLRLVHRERRNLRFFCFGFSVPSSWLCCCKRISRASACCCYCWWLIRRPARCQLLLHISCRSARPVAPRSCTLSVSRPTGALRATFTIRWCDHPVTT